MNPIDTNFSLSGPSDSSPIDASSPTGSGWGGVVASIGGDITGIIQSLQPKVTTAYGTITGSGATTLGPSLLTSASNNNMTTILVVGAVVLVGIVAFVKHKG